MAQRRDKKSERAAGEKLKKAPGNPAPRPVSLKILAEHLGLSSGTVSLVLNSSPGSEAIPGHTKKRIFEAARNLNYKPNYFARALSIKRSFLIGILTTSLAEGYDSSLLAGIERHLIDTEYVYFVASHLWSKSLLQRSMQTLLERGAEGIILINAEPPVMHIEVPVITIGAGSASSALRTLSSPSFSFLSRISIDNRLGADLMLRHLHGLGHRRIAYLLGDTQGLDTEQRWEGFQKTSTDLGLTIDVRLTIPLAHFNRLDLTGIELGAEATKELLARSRNFTAIVCFNDMSAVGALNQLRSEGIAVPSHVSVVGFDDIQLAGATSPSLTTVRQPLLEMGHIAATRIVAQIEGVPIESKTTLIVPELMVRQSSGPARRVE